MGLGEYLYAWNLEGVPEPQKDAGFIGRVTKVTSNADMEADCYDSTN